MLPHIFCCKKVCRFPPGILATLPKSSFSLPDSGLAMSIPSILLYIPVRVCYYNMVKRVRGCFHGRGVIFIQSSFIGIRKERVFPWVCWRTRGTSSARTPLHATCWRSFCCIRAFTFWCITVLRTGCTGTSTFPRPLGQPARTPPHRHRDPPRCHHRQMPVHRPRHGHRVRRDL